MKPKACVCIVTYNSAGHIEACLEAVLHQTLAPARIVVVDNASADGTIEIVERYRPEREPDAITIIPNKVNNGFAGGQNQALAAAMEAGADYALVLNPDVTLDANYLEKVVDYMERRPGAGSATGKLLFALDPSVMDSAGIGLRSRDLQGFDLGAGEPAANWDKEAEVFGVSGAAAVYRTAMIREIAIEGQFFDEDFFAYKEDVDVAWRARTLGWKAFYVPHARALHHRGWKKGGRREVPLFVRRHSYQNRFFTLVKNEPAGWQLLRLVPVLLVIEGAKLLYILLREPGLLACWPAIVRLLPAMLRKRSLIRSKAKRRGAVRSSQW